MSRQLTSQWVDNTSKLNWSSGFISDSLETPHKDTILLQSVKLDIHFDQAMGKQLQSVKLESCFDQPA